MATRVRYLKLTYRGNFSVVELAIVFAYVQDDFGETALVTAVNKDHFHVAEILVKNGADVNYRNKVRALIPGTQVFITWPVIRHGIGEPVGCKRYE